MIRALQDHKNARQNRLSKGNALIFIPMLSEMEQTVTIPVRFASFSVGCIR